MHDVGFCDLQGLLTPWVAAVTKEPRNASGKVKKNKHLVVIADSCFSGILAQDLQRLMQRDGPWNKNGCSVTVQSACSNDEPTFGGYFTPCFVHFNKPENQPFLQMLKKQWNDKSEIEKIVYRQMHLPSPRIETTMPPEKMNLANAEDPTMSPSFQGFMLTLFLDPGFFKFCFLKFSGVIGHGTRALTGETANTFFMLPAFTIMDYKLKKMAGNDTPLALFLVEDPNDKEHVVCVHIHFYDENSHNISGVNLIHHNKPTGVGYYGHLFLEENSLKQRFRYDQTTMKTLVDACKEYVKNNQLQQDTWDNFAHWHMTQSYHYQFRMKKRSDWMDDYVSRLNVEKN